MPLTQDAVLEKLKNVIDPELFVNIVDLGLIYEIKIKDADQNDQKAVEAGAEPSGSDDQPSAEPTCSTEQAAQSENPDPQPSNSGTNVFIDMTMTSPACPAGPQLIGGAQREVSSIEGVEKVEVKIVLDPPWTPDRMTEDAKDQLGIF